MIALANGRSSSKTRLLLSHTRLRRRIDDSSPREIFPAPTKPAHLASSSDAPLPTWDLQPQLRGAHSKPTASCSKLQLQQLDAFSTVDVRVAIVRIPSHEPHLLALIRHSASIPSILNFSLRCLCTIGSHCISEVALLSWHDRKHIVILLNLTTT